jgi:hypothetical protein
MMQAHPVPDVHARHSLPVEDMTRSSVAVLGTREGTNQIELRAGIDHPADAAQNPVHFAEGSESIDVNGWKARGLQQKFLVAHKYPRNKLDVGHQNTTVRNRTVQKRTCDAIVSSRASCAVYASVPHHQVLMERQHD